MLCCISETRNVTCLLIGAALQIAGQSSSVLNWLKADSSGKDHFRKHPRSGCGDRRIVAVEMSRYFSVVGSPSAGLFAQIHCICSSDFGLHCRPVRAVDTFVYSLDLRNLGFTGVDPLKTEFGANLPVAAKRLQIGSR